MPPVRWAALRAAFPRMTVSRWEAPDPRVLLPILVTSSQSDILAVCSIRLSFWEVAANMFDVVEIELRMQRWMQRWMELGVFVDRVCWVVGARHPAIYGYGSTPPPSFWGDAG